MASIYSELGKITEQSTTYNLIETVLIVLTLVFIGFAIYLAMEKDL